MVLAMLLGISTGAVILMFQGSQCEKPHREGSLPALLCPAPLDYTLKNGRYAPVK